ncbi:MAG: polysaccharide biosynthesis protein, partial [Dorea sp.]|nr:polysaccharide biosynthesis protein [Dorea sp.]
IAFTLIIFTVFRIYSSLWEYAGIEEVFSIILACLLSGLCKVCIVSVTWNVMPRSWYILDTIYLMILIGGSRFSYRMVRLRRQNRAFPWRKRKRVMIVGGGEAGRSLIGEIQNSKYLNQQVICIIDDDPKKQGKYIKGIRIVGDRNSIQRNVKRYNIQQIIITIPSAGSTALRPILDICKETDCELMIIPGVYQLVNGEVRASKLRPVNINDLLGREEIQVNLDEVMGYVAGKVIMVTGGGGSIGSELCRQIAEHRPKQLIIFDIYENNAYEIQQELKRKHPELNLVVLIGSVRDENRIESIFEQYHPEIIYHAAAHKHVPLMEDSPNEAIKNNVLGTYKMVMMADRFHAKRFVMISTDKAVNPTNIMGASKRICEMIIQTYNKMSETEFVAVRFGNVLGSNGSVIPLFKKQIAEGGPVTVTHPDIIRYFMTIPEAVSLVLQAGAYAQGGEIFVLDMGEPVKILDLAKNMIRLSGLKLGQDIEIEFTGLRPGEKLYEELLMDEEGMTDTPNKLIHIGHPIDVDEDKLSYALYVLEHAAEHETDDMRLIVESVVPTYHPKL